ncbi:MAG TPA: type I 3-dehydroquinate dehydratase [Polyangia bacterium]|nr:type I 3-dehydroquinate dehydratase [Polyangia bacterium]
MMALQEPPLVVGTTKPAGLAALAALVPRPWADRHPDLIEARLDLARADSGPNAPLPDLAAYLPACRRLEETGTPVLLTVRLVADGGRWTEDAARLPLFASALDQRACSWVDIEVESAIAPEVVGRARERGCRAIVSHHDFTGTPPATALGTIVDRARALGADIVKVATKVTSLEDHDRLLDLLRARRGEALAVIGMGAFGTPLRTYLPCVGSRLTYGFLDEVAAPGQLHASELVARLMSDCPAYAEARQKRGAR